MNFIKGDRFESLDTLRGIAAVTVCLFHFSNGIDSFLPSDNLLRISGAYGNLGVQIFFIISGFVIPFSLYQNNYSNNNMLTFFAKRLLRIEPPYLISIVLAIALKYLSTLSSLYSGPAFQIDVTGLFLHLGYLCELFQKDWLSPVYWTLAIEFQFYILIALSFTFCIATNKKYIFYIFIFMLNLPLFFHFTNRSTVFHFFPFFTIGMLLFRYLMKKNTLSEFLFITGTLLIFITVYNGIAACAASVFTLLIFFFIKKSNVVFMFLGKISYSLYLIHIIIGTRLLNLSIYFTDNTTYRLVLILIALLVSVFCSYIFYLLFEKPFMKLSHKIHYR